MIVKKIKSDTMLEIALIICVFLMSVIDCARTNGSGFYASVATDCMGFCLVPFIIFRVSFKKVNVIPYLIWLFAFPVISILIFLGKRQGIDMDIHLALILINVYIYGFFAIRLLQFLFAESQNNSNFSMSLLFYVFLSFEILALLSVNKEFWPTWFLMIFGCIYIFPISVNQENMIFRATSMGILLSFILIQGWALLRRPYFEARYLGAYTSSNVNGFFYAVSFVGTLAVGTYLFSKGKRKLGVLSRCLSALIFSFCLMTASRSACTSIVIVGVLYIFIESSYVFGNRRKSGLIKCVGVFLLGTIVYPFLYFPIRFIPALIHRPKYFHFEVLSLAERIMPYDPINSPLYVSMDEFLWSSILERIIELLHIPGGMEFIARLGDYFAWKSPFFSRFSLTIVPMFSSESYGLLGKILGIRKYIFLYYLSKSTFIGNPSLEYAQITADFACEHPHNSFIYMIYSFGYIAGLMFILLAIATPLIYLKRIKRMRANTPWYYPMCFALNITFSIIGLMEWNSYPGKMIFTMFFFSMLPLMKREHVEKDNIISIEG